MINQVKLEKAAEHVRDALGEEIDILWEDSFPTINKSVNAEVVEQLKKVFAASIFMEVGEILKRDLTA